MADPVNNLDQVRNTISGISAIITFLAVLVALFKDWLWEKINKPKLVLNFEMEAPYCTKSFFYNQHNNRNVDTYYFRLRISNTSSIPAKGVQVQVENVQRKYTDGTYHEDKQFQPINLRWTNYGNPKQNTTTILPGMGAFCDLGHVYDPSYRQFYLGSAGITKPNDSDVFLFELALESKPMNGTDLLKIGEYQIEVALAAENVMPKKKSIAITFKGPWTINEDIMFSDGIGITIQDI
jgi:hypothetical protein